MSTAGAASPRTYQLIGPSEDAGVNDLLLGLGDKEAKIRLQALISEWLRLENLVVLTGAGTSVSSGGRTMPGLEHEVVETVKATTSTPSGVQKIIDCRGKESPKSGFEDWLSYLVNANHLSTSAASPFDGVSWRDATDIGASDIAWLVDRIGKSIFAECSLVLPDTSAGASSSAEVAPHLAFLSKLIARDSNLGRSHLFTLNYDTLFEQAMEMLGIQYFDGFTGRADARFDPSVYGLDVYYPGDVAEGRVRRFDKFMHLYKLHGSIHWQVRGDEMRARHPDLAPFAAYRKLDHSSRAAELEKIAATLPSVGILLTANKFVQTLSLPFAHVFRAFQIRLGSPQTFLLVLGYGFGDDHITRIIETALMNPSLVMLVVEPNPQSPTIQRIRRYKELGKRAFVLTATQEAFDLTQFKYATFDDFSRSVMPDVQWLDDFLRLRRFERQISAGKAGDDIGIS